MSVVTAWLDSGKSAVICAALDALSQPDLSRGWPDDARFSGNAEGSGGMERGSPLGFELASAPLPSVDCDLNQSANMADSMDRAQDCRCWGA